jgi:hypothetical protein
VASTILSKPESAHFPRAGVLRAQEVERSSAERVGISQPEVNAEIVEFTRNSEIGVSGIFHDFEGGERLTEEGQYFTLWLRDEFQWSQATAYKFINAAEAFGNAVSTR